jgi:hypothetical protein
MEIVSYSLAANADNDALNFRIPGDQLGQIVCSLNGYYFRWFRHVTA